eukprot:CAMPEP_0172491642 /NCGR_PEP_ID=MMETSP1066-20121228/22524_1 /TAXON_ID=671091 /ORGANISM="Coscinodiscus wailesii, Strain CCMP2513" /LENGTH=591 /DNA_ID=CAMNT_0013260803 /DNA_START=1 /DNA_END=1776 /DNA_ORIENTATION=-
MKGTPHLLIPLLLSLPHLISGVGCGDGTIGNGKCLDPTHCCSEWGYCGPGTAYCGVSPPTTTTPPPPSSSPPAAAHDDNRLIAYLGNWQDCPSLDQIAKYTHIVIAFAVSYTWSPRKNICSESCEIDLPPVCDNAPHWGLVSDMQAAGKKVILSFGGAGMGGSWEGDPNDCWEYCFGREGQVVDRLVEIVEEMGLDGVDIDYEYFYEDDQNGSDFTKGEQAQTFLMEVTTGLRQKLPAGAEITHAPMDVDMVPGKAYYDIIVKLGSQLDYLMPQYYNGITRPVAKFSKALNHYKTITNDVFNGDATKMVFGFCISDCSGTGSNASADQAAQVMTLLGQTYSCNGGAFFWVAEHDVGGEWSTAVSAVIRPNLGCSDDEPPVAPVANPITVAPAVNPTSLSPTVAPVVNPTSPSPTVAPAVNPTSPSPTTNEKCDRACPAKYTGLKPYNGCREFYHCVDGDVTGDLISCKDGTLFDVTYQYCNWKEQVTCDATTCDTEPTYPPIETTIPTASPVTEPTPTKNGCALTCPPHYTGYKAYNACQDYYYCQNGVLSGYLQKCIEGTLWDESIQNFNWPDQMTCHTPACDTDAGTSD